MTVIVSMAVIMGIASVPASCNQVVDLNLTFEILSVCRTYVNNGS